MSYWEIIEEFSKESFSERQNKIEKILEKDFEEVMINDWSKVYIESCGRIERIEGVFQSPQEYEREVGAFLSSCNQRISVDKPLVSFDYLGMYRIHLVHSGITDTGTVMSIRKASTESFTQESFVQQGFCTQKEMNLMKWMVKNKKTVFISGGTSSGKTTLLNFLLQFTQEDERLIIIEDTKEVKAPLCRNVIYLRTKEGEMNVKEVSVSDLVKSSLRMRPDRIILGEIRRDEVVEFLHAMNTGHEGSLSTGHGNSAQDMIARLEILLLEAGIPLSAAQRYLGRGIDYIIQLGDKNKRKVVCISQVLYCEEKVVLRHES